MGVFLSIHILGVYLEKKIPIRQKHTYENFYHWHKHTFYDKYTPKNTVTVLLLVLKIAAPRHKVFTIFELDCPCPTILEDFKLKLILI